MIGMEGCFKFEEFWFPETENHMTQYLKATSNFEVGHIARNSYQIGTLVKFVKAIPEGRRKFVLDVGGHVGTWSIKFAKIFERVVAFEPIKVHAKCFRANLVECGNVELWECGLGSESGVATFVRKLENSGATHVKGLTELVADKDLERAVIMPLDAFCYSPDAIKIDVEGFEKSVLIGGEETIRKWKPVICLEQKNHGYYGEDQFEAMDLLRDWGATVVGQVNNDFILRWESS